MDFHSKVLKNLHGLNTKYYFIRSFQDKIRIKILILYEFLILKKYKNWRHDFVHQVQNVKLGFFSKQYSTHRIISVYLVQSYLQLTHVLRLNRWYQSENFAIDRTRFSKFTITQTDATETGWIETVQHVLVVQESRVLVSCRQVRGPFNELQKKRCKLYLS